MLMFHQKQNQTNEISGYWNAAMVTHSKFDCTARPDIMCFSFDGISRNSGSHEHPEWPTVLVRYQSALTNETVLKKMRRALCQPTCQQLWGQWIKSRSESKDSSYAGRADILEQWLYTSADLGWNQVHGFGAYSEVHLTPLCLGRWEGVSFLRSDW